MNNKRDDVSISRAELVVLARFSGSKKPTEEQINAELKKFTLEGKPSPNARSAVESLINRNLLGIDPPKKKQSAVPKRYSLTEAGKSALRAALGLPSLPTWAQVRDRHLPSLGLGLVPGSTAAAAAGSNLGMTMVRMKLTLPKATSLTAVCDELLFRKVGFTMAKVSLAELRARLLAEALAVGEEVSAQKVVEKAVRAWLRPVDMKKQSLGAALARDWVSGQVNHWLDGGTSTTAAGPPPVHVSPPAPPTSPATSIAVSLDTLADAVHETLPRIGADGRYSAEKVFVSAVWRGLEQERRTAGMTFDAFKRSLVQAMRAGKVRLARADLIGAMDAKLVSDSEILDNGATFHFVLEQKHGAPGAERRTHVR